MYRVVEKFVSINGEGTNAGKLAAFIRFAGCNLNCSFCDTSWANEGDVPYGEESAEEIYQYVKESGVEYVTLTGGEPLLQKNMTELVKRLMELPYLTVEFETNGSILLKEMDEFRKKMGQQERILFTMDYKLPKSGMEQHMKRENFGCLGKTDTVKFVAGSREDLNRMKQVIEKNKLQRQCNLYVSPVFGSIEPSKIVEYLIEEKLVFVTMQLQMHKFIWDPDQRGV